ncbi:MAG: hypothetical protein ACKVQW_04430 [Pyrinomonadaceae bacterium]
MIDSAACRDIILTYTRHGWILRRVLLTAELQSSLGDASGELFVEVDVNPGSLDAAWFSRPPATGEIAWELRHLNIAPFALLEYLDETAGDFEDKLRAVETRLTESVAKKRNA